MMEWNGFHNGMEWLRPPEVGVCGRPACAQKTRDDAVDDAMDDIGK